MISKMFRNFTVCAMTTSCFWSTCPNKKMRVILALLPLLIAYYGHAQVDYSIKTEAGLLVFKNNTLDIDPGPNWEGFYLSNVDGIDFSVINGITYKSKLFAGLGIGYMNFKGTSGISAFTDVEYLPLRTRLTPLVNLKLGFTHVWNQYERGSGTGLGELALGLNYRLKGMDLFVKSGLMLTQQSLFIPIRIGGRL